MRIGIDLGGTKIEAIALDSAGKELVRERRPTPADDYEGTLEAIKSLHLHLEQQMGTNCPLGIGTPGSLSPASGSTPAGL